MYSHFVSQVILKNFASKDRKIRVFDKQTRDFLKQDYPIKDICGMQLSEPIFAQIEKKWGKKIENRIGNLLEKYQGDIVKIWADSNNHEPLRRLLSLHFIRSFLFMARFQAFAEEGVKELLEGLPPEHHDLVARDFIHNVVESTPQIWDDLYIKTKSHLDKFKLELAEANSSENFIIGDFPILNNKQAVMDSQFFVLPITPRYVIGVAKEKRLLHLSKRDTRKIKNIAKRDAIRYWFCQPES